MTDLLVRLYNLPDPAARVKRMESAGVAIRRPMAYEKTLVLSWVRDNFIQGWADECSVAFARRPVSCFVAVRDGAIVGFSCYDCTFRGFYGPAGVAEAQRGSGIGSALLLAALGDMRAQGYAYAVIGYASSSTFYQKVAGARVIEGSGTRAYPAKLKTD